MGRSGHWLAALSVLFAAGAIGGCGTQYRTLDYTDPIYEGDDESVAAESNTIGGPWAPSKPASLPQGASADSYKTPPLKYKPVPTVMTQQQFVDHLNSLVYDRSAENGQLAIFTCELPSANAPAPNPPGPNPNPPAPAPNPPANPCPWREYVPVFIEPEVGMKNTSIDDIKGYANGIIVARIVAYDTGRATPGGTGNPNKEGRAQNVGVGRGRHAWWLVKPAPTGGLQSLFIGRATKPGNLYDTLSTKPLGFKDCHAGEQNPPTWDPKTPTMARWWDCAYSIKGHATRRKLLLAVGDYFRLAALGPFAQPDTAIQTMVDVSLDGSSWVRCGLGCCATQ